MGRRQAMWTALPSVLGPPLAVVGSVIGNLESDQLPATWDRLALPILGVVVVAIFLVSRIRGQVQGSARWRDPHLRSPTTRHAAFVVVAAYELLWAVGGLAENLAARSLPTALKPYAGALLGGVVACAAVLALLDYGLQSAPPVEATSRQALLAKLHTRYSRRREDALRGASLVMLGLRAEPEAVSRPALTMGTLTEGGKGHLLTDPRALRADTPITEVYDEADGHLLILGQPGAGKSTLLVELGLELVRRARADAKVPLPVICNLATWAISRRPLEQWLIEELVVAYQVPSPVARQWVAHGAIVPLLDGLDEVRAAHRAACIAAINVYHQAHPHRSLAVCSQSAAYHVHAASGRLVLRNAVVIEPLTDGQIDGYLESGGEPLARLRAAVAADKKLRDVVRTPLLLRVVALTYEGLPWEVIPPVADDTAWVQQLFSEYVTRMLRRRRRLEAAAPDTWEEVEQPLYSPEETSRYLIWLARQMRSRGLVEFRLERLQAEWLPGARAQRQYRLVALLVVGLIFGSAAGVITGFFYGPGIGLLVGVVNGLIVGSVDSLLFAYRILITGELRWSWRKLAIVDYDGELRHDVPFQFLYRLPPGVLGGLNGMVLAGLVGGLIVGLGSGLRSGVIAGLHIGLVGAMLGVLLGELISLMPEREIRDSDFQTPNEGVRRSVRISALIALGAGVVGGLVGVLVGGLIAGLIGGLLLAQMGGLCFGGTDAIRHTVLRWELRRRRLAPLHLVRFLNYAADHVLLQEMGGAYRFVHMLLRDYFADAGRELDGTGKSDQRRVQQ